MAAEDQGGDSGSWQSLLIDQTEEEEVSRMAYVTYSRHIAMRRQGDTLEFAHIWTAGTAPLDRGNREEGSILSLTVDRSGRALEKLDDLATMVAGIARCRDTIAAAIRRMEANAR